MYVLSNIVKITAKINTAKYYQHFTFFSFTVLDKLKALHFKFKQGRPIDHQASTQ